MRAGVFFRHLAREAGGERGKLIFFVLSLAVGVAAVVGVAGFSEGIDRGIRREARQILAADLIVRGLQPIPDEVKALLDERGVERTDQLEMLTVVTRHTPVGTADEPAADEPPPSVLVELKAVTGRYPFYGVLALEPDRPLGELLDAESVVASPELLERLELEVGDDVDVGGEPYRIVGVVTSEPDKLTGAFNFGPRLFVSGAGLERAGLEQFGSRIFYRTLARLPEDDSLDVGVLADELEAVLGEGSRFRVESFREAQPELRQGLQRVGRFLGLAALVSLILGGVGVSQTVRAWLAGRLDDIAVLKCLGYRPREVLALYLALAAGLGLAGSLLGIVLGLALQEGTSAIIRDVLPVELISLWQPRAMLRGLLLGVGVAVLFSLPPVIEARRVPPVRVLRRDTDPLPPSLPARIGLGATLVLGVLGVAAWQAKSWLLGLAFTGGVLVAGGLLGAAAWGLSRLAARPRAGARLWLRHGLAALARPGAATVSAIVALGLGVLVVLTMFVVERHLTGQLESGVPEGAPSAFFVDIQRDQWDDVLTVLEETEAASIDSVPVVMAQLTAIDGKSVAEILAEQDEEEDRWALQREQRLTYLDELADDNVIVEGELWGQDGVDEVSVEQEFAADLGVELGSVLEFDVQGVTVPITVTSLRTVEWEGFGINFFLVVEPGVLDDAPQSRVAAARLREGSEQEVQDRIAALHPNVTMLRIGEILKKISVILGKLGLGVRLLGSVTVLAGLFILAGAIGASSVRRGREVALYKTLGMTRGQVVRIFATEYALVGLVAAVLGTACGTAIGWGVVTHALDIEWRMPVTLVLPAVLGTIVLAVGAGLLASASALQRRPIEVLRGE